MFFHMFYSKKLKNHLNLYVFISFPWTNVKNHSETTKNERKCTKMVQNASKCTKNIGKKRHNVPKCTKMHQNATELYIFKKKWALAWAPCDLCRSRSRPRRNARSVNNLLERLVSRGDKPIKLVDVEFRSEYVIASSIAFENVFIVFDSFEVLLAQWKAKSANSQK